MRTPIILTVAIAVLAGCSRPAVPVAVVPPPPPPPAPAAPLPRPLPPAGSSATVVLPPRLADGSFDTPNRAPTPAAALWQLRAGLNVAALRCNDDAVLADYNRFVRGHTAALAKAHAAAQSEAGGQAAFDGRMTKLYNYFALPPVQAAFCAAAATIAAEAATAPNADLPRLATLGLPVLDAPFTNFFVRYAAYRSDLAAWEAGQGQAGQAQVAQAQAAPAPRLAYDMAVMTADPVPRRPGIAVASR